MQLRDIIMSGGVLPAMLKQDLVRKDEEDELKKKAAVTQGMNNGGSVYTEKMGKPPQDIDGASAGRKFGKNEPNVPEQPGSRIRVDGKPVKPEKKMASGGSASSRADGCATKGKTKGRFV